MGAPSRESSFDFPAAGLLTHAGSLPVSGSSILVEYIRFAIDRRLSLSMNLRAYGFLAEPIGYLSATFAGLRTASCSFENPGAVRVSVDLRAPPDAASLLDGVLRQRLATQAGLASRDLNRWRPRH